MQGNSSKLGPKVHQTRRACLSPQAGMRPRGQLGNVQRDAQGQAWNVGVSGADNEERHVGRECREGWGCKAVRLCCEVCCVLCQVRLDVGGHQYTTSKASAHVRYICACHTTTKGVALHATPQPRTWRISSTYPWHIPGRIPLHPL